MQNERSNEKKDSQERRKIEISDLLTSVETNEDLGNASLIEEISKPLFNAEPIVAKEENNTRDKKEECENSDREQNAPCLSAAEPHHEPLQSISSPLAEKSAEESQADNEIRDATDASAAEPDSKIARKRKIETEGSSIKEKKNDNVKNVIAEHYNTVHQRVEERKESSIYSLRLYNNFIKAVLIQTHTPKGAEVLDLGCGRGGDLLKYGQARVRKLVGIDIAEKSLENARSRVKAPMNATFLCMDPFSNSLSGHGLFDVVSSQFAFHYAFSSEKNAKTAIENVSKSLRSGGVFYCTIPSKERILTLLGEETVYENEVLKIELVSFEKDAKFGNCYKFRLTDAIDDCPEYLVDYSTFKEMLEGASLFLKKMTSFEEYLKTNRDSFLFQKMVRGAVMNVYEKEVFSLYDVWICYKRDKK